MIVHPSRPTRPGITLLEVLAAIFIMGVGMLALLTLFPLGALSMARAVRQDRAVAIAGNAAGMATSFDLRNDSTVVAGMANPGNPWLAPDPNGPGYPVFVDPSYRLLGQQYIGRSGIGATDSPGLARVLPWYATNAQTIARWFSFNDEIEFKKTGDPVGGGASVNRPGTYTWAYLLRRPRSADPDLCELTVIVFSERKTELYDDKYERMFHNPANLGGSGSNLVNLPYTAGDPADKPNIRKGAWLLDTTYSTKTVGVDGTGAAKTYGSVAGQFYQVVNVIDDNAGTMSVELETPLKADVKTMVLVPNVVAVVERGTSWQP